MHERIQLASESGLIVLHDEAVDLPAEPHQDELRKTLNSGAAAGSWFVMDADDAVDLRVDLWVDEEPEGLPSWFSPLADPCRLELPAGRLKVGEQGPIQVEPVSWAVSVLGPSPFEARAYNDLMTARFGRKAWRYHDFVDRLGMVGCTSTTFLPVTMLSSRVREYWYIPLGLVLLSWVLHLLLTRVEPYRSLDAKREAYEASFPQFAVHLQRLEPDADMDGGVLGIQVGVP